MKASAQHWSTNRSLVLILMLMVVSGIAGCLGNRAPIAILSAAVISGPAPLDVSFDLSYCEDSEGDAISYLLDFGDGSDPEEGANPNIIIHHTYHTGGVFIATLTAIDVRGEQAKDHQTITVNDVGPSVGLTVGKTAPGFTAHTTDGGEITLSDTRGLVVLLDFWGVWCPPCKSRMPHLKDVYNLYSSRGLVVILVSTDPDEQDTIDFLDKNNYTDFISVWEPGGKSGNPIKQLYEVKSFPHTFLLDRQGVIRYVGHPDDLSMKMIEGLL